MNNNQINPYRFSFNPDPATVFITEWTVGALETINLPLSNLYTYDCYVDYGEGGGWLKINSWSDPNASHTYTSAGSYQVKIAGVSCPGFKVDNNATTRVQITDVIQWGDVGFVSFDFYGCSNMVVSATDIPNLSGVSSFLEMFRDCSSITTIPNLNNWNTSTITSLQYMFSGATLFNQDIPDWDVSNVTNAFQVFGQATSFNGSLINWVTSSFVNCQAMFYNADAFNQPLDHFDVSNVTNFKWMFRATNIFNQDLNSWTLKTTGTVSFEEMFWDAKAFNGNITSWDTSAVTNMDGAFKLAIAFNQDISGWNTSSVVNMFEMFQGATLFNQDLPTVGSSWDVSNVTTMFAMFSQCTNFNGLLTDWATTSCLTMQAMFNQCTNFNRPVNHFDMNGVSTIRDMFSNCIAFNQPIPDWDTSTLNSMLRAFTGCSSFNQPLTTDGVKWDVSGVTNMESALNNCTVFNQDLSSWDVSNVTTLEFFGVGTAFDIDNYTNMLIAWAGQVVQNGVTWDMGTARYSCELGQPSWDDLTNNDSWTINDGGCVEWNTLIGGVGATIVTSKADFAAMSSVSESNIYAFNIDGSNNVSFVLLQNYTIVTTSFNASSDLTHYLDTDGYCTAFYNFFNCPNLEHVYLPSVTNFVDQFTLHIAAGLKKINMESMASVNDRLWVVDAEELKKLDLRSLTGMPNTQGGGSFVQLRRLERLFLGNLTSMSVAELDRILVRNSGRNPSFHLTGNISGNMKVYHSSAFGVADRAAFTRIRSGWAVGDTCTINGLVYTAVNGAPATDGEFDASIGGNTAHTNFRNAINADTRPGSADISCISDNAFACVRATAVGVGGNSITAVMGGGNTGSASVDWSPFKYGSDVHHSLVDMRDIEGATLVEVGAPISVDPPTGVSVSNITANSVDVNFTPPTPNANGNDGYEVWLDDGGRIIKLFEWDEISASGDTISGLQSGTDYDLIMRTIDGEYNFSAFTSVVQFTTL